MAFYVVGRGGLNGKTKMKKIRTRLDLLKEFEEASPNTLFDQHTLCAVLNCSESIAEANRINKKGVKYNKIGRSVRYKKTDILNYIEAQSIFHSPFDKQIQDKEKLHNVLRISDERYLEIEGFIRESFKIKKEISIPKLILSTYKKCKSQSETVLAMYMLGRLIEKHLGAIQ